MTINAMLQDRAFFTFCFDMCVGQFCYLFIHIFGSMFEMYNSNTPERMWLNVKTSANIIG